MKRSVCCLAVIANVLASASAFANGRFPNAQQLREPVPGSLVVSATYGLLVSGNDGQDFQFVCESALFGKALMGSWVDPLLETLPDGTIVSGSQNGLRVSRDRGCSFATDFTLPHDASFVGAGPDANAPKGTVVDVCPGYDSTSSLVALTTLISYGFTRFRVAAEPGLVVLAAVGIAALAERVRQRRTDGASSRVRSRAVAASDGS